MNVIRGKRLTTFDVAPDGFHMSFGLSPNALRRIAEVGANSDRPPQRH